jgi:RNA polymerase sigma-70 factor (ECF subfamily)
MDAKLTTPSPDGAGGRPQATASLAVDWGDALAAHDRWLRTAVLARTGEPQAGDEVMQDVALAAVAQKSPVLDPSRLGGWLYRLAVRQALLHRRKCGRRRKLLERHACRGGAVDSSTTADPLDWLLRDERRALVREAMATLPRRDAEILLLKYTENWSYRELAAHLGLTESAVEARLHRARGRLRDALAAARVIEVSE